MKPVIAVGLLLGTAVSANAADLAPRPYTKAPPMVAAIYDWTGFYVGVNGGYGLGRSRTNNAVPGLANNTFFLQPEGAIGGGQVGYNLQTNMGILGPVLIGVEADIQAADLRNSNTRLNGVGGLVSTYDQRLDWFGTVRGRVGLVTGSTVTYVTGGYAYGDTRTSVTHTLGAASATFTSPSGRGGYVIGSGIEAAFGGNWTGKIEYLYMDLGNRTDAFTALVPQTMTSRTRENIFRAGLNYRIGGGYVAPIVANWTGFYLGGNVGSGISRNPSAATAAGVTDTFNLAHDGYNGGVQAGYNWQAGNWVFGVEADIQATTHRDRTTCVGTCLPAQNIVFDQRLEYFGTARGRLGYSVGSSLFYLTGGYAFGEVRTRATTTVAGVALPTVTARNNLDGYAVGGGIETPFTFLGLFGPSWTTKTEYLYVDLGRFTTTLADGVPFTSRNEEHIFRTGINYKFNSPVVARY